MKGQHSLSVPKINSYPQLSLKGGAQEEQNSGLRLEVFQIFQNRNLRYPERASSPKASSSEVIDSWAWCFSGHLAAIKRYFKSR